MKSSQRKLGFVLAIVLLALVFIGSAFWSVQTPEVRASLADEPESFLPVVMGVEQGNPPTPTKTPPSTNTPIPSATATASATTTGTATATATATNTPTVTGTATATATSTPTATATLSGSETPVPPKIKNFMAEPDLIISGAETTLSWEIKGESTYLEIDPGDIDVTGQTQIIVKPTSSTDYTLTAYNSSISFSTATVLVDIGEVGEELLVFEWDGDVTRSENGFPRHEPPTENGDWTTPINFAEGTFYFYVLIRDQPVSQEMILQYCVWQLSVNYAEACADRQRVKIQQHGSAVTWSDKVEDISNNNEKPGRVNWIDPRYRDAVAIKNKTGDPVSGSYDWSGENPNAWFPMDWHFMTVVVEKGKVFSGWDNYLNPTP